MAVDFFNTACADNCNLDIFGICDDTPPPARPAYISRNIDDNSSWIVEVTNPKNIDVNFIAIDCCIDLRKPDGISLESRCDCMITYNNTITFIELKDRISRGWLSKAKSQVENTISLFEANHDSSVYAHKKVLIANKQRPFFQTGFQTIIDEIKNNTGYIADVRATYDIK